MREGVGEGHYSISPCTDWSIYLVDTLGKYGKSPARRNVSPVGPDVKDLEPTERDWQVNIRHHSARGISLAMVAWSIQRHTLPQRGESG